MLTPAAPKTLRWQRPNPSPWMRQFEVFSATFQFLFFLWWDRLFGQPSSGLRRRRARWLVKTLLNLGPTFIKFGQALSTRADIIPLEYVEELGQLQDNVPAISPEAAIAVIEAELGTSVYLLFRDFQPLPLAAASLGQVHKAWLHTGEAVVVKVQRPGLKRLFDADVKAVYKVIQFCRRFFPDLEKYDLEALYHEFFTILYQEIDYIQEGKNAERFQANFRTYAQILVPKIYWQYTTSKVLTMEYLPGIKVDDRQTIEACGLNPKRLNQIGICCYLKQLLLDGFFQADPHPGNIAVSSDGRLIFYDFGMMAEVKSLAKDQMVRTFFGVLRKDTDVVVDTLIQIGLIEPVGDMVPVRRLIKFLLEKFTEKPVDFRAFNEIKAELYVMFEQQPFRLPAQMMFVLKALTTLDGIARALDPQYNFLVAAQPFVKSITVSQSPGNAVSELVRQAREFVKYRLQQPSSTEKAIRRFEERLEQGELLLQVQNQSSDRYLKRISLALNCLIYACLTGFSGLIGAVLFGFGYPQLAIALGILTLFLLVVFLRTLITLALRTKLDRLLD